MRIVAVSGKKQSGKTTLLEKLTVLLRERGLRVGVVKNDHHGFDMDQPGKDTWRLKQAGAAATLIVGPERVGLVLDTPERPSLEEAAEAWLGGMDLVLAEGFSRSGVPKVEVFRSGAHDEPLLGPEDGLLALATDDPDHAAVRAVREAGIPVFGLDDAASLADLLLAGLLSNGK